MDAIEKQVRRALRRLRNIKGVDRINRRAAYMRQLPDDVRHEVARRLAAGERR